MIKSKKVIACILLVATICTIAGWVVHAENAKPLDWANTAATWTERDNIVNASEGAYLNIKEITVATERNIADKLVTEGLATTAEAAISKGLAWRVMLGVASRGIFVVGAVMTAVDIVNLACQLWNTSTSSQQAEMIHAIVVDPTTMNRSYNVPGSWQKSLATGADKLNWMSRHVHATAERNLLMKCDQGQYPTMSIFGPPPTSQEISQYPGNTYVTYGRPSEDSNVEIAYLMSHFTTPPVTGTWFSDLKTDAQNGVSSALGWYQGILNVTPGEYVIIHCMPGTDEPLSDAVGTNTIDWSQPKAIPETFQSAEGKTGPELVQMPEVQVTPETPPAPQVELLNPSTWPLLFVPSVWDWTAWNGISTALNAKIPTATLWNTALSDQGSTGLLPWHFSIWGNSVDINWWQAWQDKISTHVFVNVSAYDLLNDIIWLWFAWWLFNYIGGLFGEKQSQENKDEERAEAVAEEEARYQRRHSKK